MSTEPKNAPVTEAHRKIAEVAYLDCHTNSEEIAQLIANFVASETAALREQVNAANKAISEANWILSGYVDAGGGSGELMKWAKQSFDWNKVSCHKDQRDALAAQCALLREALGRIALLNRTDEILNVSLTMGSTETIALSALAATPETASAELAELRKDKAGKLAAEIVRYCYGWYNGDSAGTSSALAYYDGTGKHLPGYISQREIIRDKIIAATP